MSERRTDPPARSVSEGRLSVGDRTLPRQRAFASAGRGTAGNLLRSLRLFSLPVSVLPVLLSVAVVRAVGAWDGWTVALSAAGAGLLHLAGNLLNDWFAFRAGVDRCGPEAAGRPGRVLVTGGLTARTVLIEAVICLLLAGLAAGLLSVRVGWGAWVWAVAAGGLLYSYTGPPLRLKYRAMGEGVIFLVFGPLLMCGAAWAQTGGLEWEALALSVPVGLATTAVLVGNNIRDRDEDGRAGIRTLAHFAGGRPARGLYVALVLIAALTPAVAAAMGAAPRGLLAVPLTLALLGKPPHRHAHRSPPPGHRRPHRPLRDGAVPRSPGLLRAVVRICRLDAFPWHGRLAHGSHGHLARGLRRRNLREWGVVGLAARPLSPLRRGETPL